MIKKFLSLATLAVIGLFAQLAQGQFGFGIPSYSAFTPSGGTNALTVGSAATVTMAGSSNNIIPVGQRGFGVAVYARAAGTSLATNTLVFELSGDGANFVLQPTLSVFVTNNTATPVAYYTNFPETIQNVGNVKAVRLKYITNSAAQITYWSNIWINTRQ